MSGIESGKIYYGHLHLVKINGHSRHDRPVSAVEMVCTRSTMTASIPCSACNCKWSANHEDTTES